MDFKVEIGGSTLNRAMIYEMYYQIDIFNFYAKATLKIKDVTGTFFNKIKTGMEVVIRFFDNTQDYKNYMRVLSFDKSSANQHNIVEDITIKLISSWYFDSRIADASYFGNYSDILNKIINQMQVNYFTTDILATEDAARYRYRIGETEQQFLQRILKYSMKGNLPVYLYTNAQGKLLLRGIKDFVDKETDTAIIMDSSEQMNISPSDSHNYNRFKISAYSMKSDTSASNSFTTTILTTGNFKVPAASTIPKSATLNNTEINNPQCETSTPPIKLYSNWNRTPDDALAVSIRENFERNINVNRMVTISPMWLFNDFDLGKKIKVYLPYEPILDNKTGKSCNLGEGEYFVKHIDYIFRNNLYKMKTYLVQSRY